VQLADGSRAQVRDRGPRNAPVLVLVHGSQASLLTWEPWASRLQDTFPRGDAGYARPRSDGRRDRGALRETYPERVTQLILLDLVIESCTQKLSRNMKSISRGLGSPNRALVKPLTVPTVAGALILLAGKVKFG
jgi:hypothetical protein